MKSCPKCGNPNPSGKFCIKCGAPLTEPLKSEADEIIKNEAEKIDNNDNETSEKVIETKNVVENNKAEKADVEKNDAVHNEVSQNENAEPVIKNEPVKSNKKGIITMSVIIALVLVCVGGYFIYQNNQNNQKDEPIADKDEFKEDISKKSNIDQSAISEIENGKYVEAVNKIGKPLTDNSDLDDYSYIKDYDVNKNRTTKIIIEVEERIESQALLGSIHKFPYLSHNKEKGYFIEDDIVNENGKNVNIYYFIDTVYLSINYIAIVDETSGYDVVDIQQDVLKAQSKDRHESEVCTLEQSGNKMEIGVSAINNIINKISVTVFVPLDGVAESAITDELKAQIEEAALNEIGVSKGEGVGIETDIKNGNISVKVTIDINKASDATKKALNLDNAKESKLSDFVKSAEAGGATCINRSSALDADTAIPYLKDRLLELNEISEEEYYDSTFSIKYEENGCFIIHNYYDEGTHTSTVGWYSIDINTYEIRNYMTQEIIDTRDDITLVS